MSAELEELPHPAHPDWGVDGRGVGWREVAMVGVPVTISVSDALNRLPLIRALDLAAARVVTVEPCSELSEWRAVDGRLVRRLPDLGVTLSIEESADQDATIMADAAIEYARSLLVVSASLTEARVREFSS